MAPILSLALALCAVGSSLQLVKSDPIGKRSFKNAATFLREPADNFQRDMSGFGHLLRYPLTTRSLKKYLMPSNSPQPKTKELKDKTSANSEGKPYVKRDDQNIIHPFPTVATDPDSETYFPTKGVNYTEVKELVESLKNAAKSSAPTTVPVTSIIYAATMRQAKRAAETIVSSSCGTHGPTTRPPGDCSIFTVTFTTAPDNCAPLTTKTKPIGCHHTAFDETKTGPAGPTLVHHSPLSCDTITMTRPVPCHSRAHTSMQSGELTDTVIIYEPSADCGHGHPTHHSHTHSHHTNTHKDHTHTHTHHTHSDHTKSHDTHSHHTHSHHTHSHHTHSHNTQSQSAQSQSSEAQTTSSHHTTHSDDHTQKTSQQTGDAQTNKNGANPSKVSTTYTFKSCSMATHTAVQVYTPCMDKGTSTWCPESTAAQGNTPTQRPNFECAVVTRTVSTFSSPKGRINWIAKRFKKSTGRISISTLTPDGPKTAKPTDAGRPVTKVNTVESSVDQEPWATDPTQRTQALPVLVKSVDSDGVTIAEETLYVDAATPATHTLPSTLLTVPSPSPAVKLVKTQPQESIIKIYTIYGIDPVPVHTDSPHSGVSKTGHGKVVSIDRPSVKHKGFRIKTKVFYGDLKYENLTIQNPIDPKRVSTPLLSTNTTTAARFYLDKSTSSLALCCTKSQQTYGLVLIRDRDNDAYGTVHLGKEVGTARIGFDSTERKTEDLREPIVWKNDRFGSWLVCQRPTTDVFELRWWDVVTNRGVDQWACAKVELLAEEIDGEHEEC